MQLALYSRTDNAYRPQVLKLSSLSLGHQAGSGPPACHFVLALTLFRLCCSRHGGGVLNRFWSSSIASQ
jgi:hypothetical protein